MATFSNIAGAEPSTVTFRVGTVTIARGSTTEHQEILCVGDPDSSIAIGAVLNAAPASTAWGLVTRPVGYSTTVSVANTVTIQGNSTVSIVGPTSTAAPAASDTGVVVRQVGYSTVVSVANTVTIQGNSTVSINGPVSTAAPATSDTGVIVRQVGYSTIVTVAAMPAGSTTVSVANTVTIQGNSTVNVASPISSVAPSSGSSGLVTREVIDARVTAASTSAFAASTAFTIASSVASVRAYVTAYSITSTDLTATVLRFMGGSTLLWPVRAQATSSAITGANLAAGSPGYLFRGDAAGPLTLNISGSSRAGWTVGVSYYLAP